MPRRDPNTDLLADALALLRAGSPAPAAPPPPPETPWSRLGIGVAIVLLGAFGTWAGTSLTGVGTLGPKMDIVSKQLDGVVAKVDTISQQSTGQQITIGKHELRLGVLEQTQARLLDRMRVVEGHGRLAAPAPGASEQTGRDEP